MIGVVHNTYVPCHRSSFKKRLCPVQRIGVSIQHSTDTSLRFYLPLPEVMSFPQQPIPVTEWGEHLKVQLFLENVGPTGGKHFLQSLMEVTKIVKSVSEFDFCPLLFLPPTSHRRPCDKRSRVWTDVSWRSTRGPQAKVYQHAWELEREQKWILPSDPQREPALPTSRL